MNAGEEDSNTSFLHVQNSVANRRLEQSKLSSDFSHKTATYIRDDLSRDSTHLMQNSSIFVFKQVMKYFVVPPSQIATNSTVSNLPVEKIVVHQMDFA